MKTLDHLHDNPPADRPVDAPPLWREFAPQLDAQKVLWSQVVPGGGHGLALLRRGTSLRVTTLAPGANFSLVMYAAGQTLERYNMPDTLKAQHTAHLRRGHVLMSDMGQAMASITEDTLGWHDPLGALLDEATLVAKYPAQRYGTHRNAMARAGLEGLLVELSKQGLVSRDLVAPVNFFSKVSVDDEGRFVFAPGHAPQGATVELRCEMDLLAAWSTAPHPLDPAPAYTPAPVGLAAWRSGPAPPQDFCRSFRPENARALHNTELSYL